MVKFGKTKSKYLKIMAVVSVFGGGWKIRSFAVQKHFNGSFQYVVVKYLALVQRKLDGQSNKMVNYSA